MHERAPFHIKALHGFTGSVGNLVFVVFELFVLFFYQRVVGLDGRLVGLAIFISLAARGRNGFRADFHCSGALAFGRGLRMGNSGLEPCRTEDPLHEAHKAAQCA